MKKQESMQEQRRNYIKEIIKDMKKEAKIMGATYQELLMFCIYDQLVELNENLETMQEPKKKKTTKKKK